MNQEIRLLDVVALTKDIPDYFLGVRSCSTTSVRPCLGPSRDLLPSPVFLLAETVLDEKGMFFPGRSILDRVKE